MYYTIFELAEGAIKLAERYGITYEQALETIRVYSELKRDE